MTERSPLAERLFAPVDIASLVVIRIAFGLSLVIQWIRYFTSGRVHDNYVDPSLHFKFFGFSWVPTLPDPLVPWFFGLMLVLSIFVTLGYRYRTSTIALAVCIAIWFFWDETYFNNHFYLELLLAVLFVFLPANRAFSLDAKRDPELRSETTPAWTVYLLQFQVGLAYFYGGLAKFEPDWMTGIPARALLSDHYHDDWGPVLLTEGMGLLLAWSGLVFDLLVVPALLWKRTRVAAFLVALVFHVSNHFLWRIGVFPWMMIPLTTIFFEPSWPRRFLGKNGKSDTPAAPSKPTVAANRPLLLAGLAAFVAFQLLWPFRHHFYPGRVVWREEGFLFGWHMMLRQKFANVAFKVVHDGREVPLELDLPITPKQWQVMSLRPRLMLNFAHWLRDEAERQGYPGAQVHASAQIMLNGRPAQFIIDPDVDLAQYEDTLGALPFIRPLETETPPPRAFLYEEIKANLEAGEQR